jgi:hypothetical protein
VLGDAFACGALAAEEREQRLSCAWAARSISELAALTGDLPGPGLADVAQARRDSDVGEWMTEWRWWFGAAIIMSALWGIQAIRSAPGFFWPLVPLGIWAAILIAVAVWPRPEAH